MSSKHGFRVIASLSHMAPVKVRGIESYCWIFRCVRTLQNASERPKSIYVFFAMNMA